MRNSGLDQMADALREGVERAQQQGASAAKIRLRRWQRSGCSFENARLKETESAEGLGFDVEVVVRGKKVSVSGNNLADLNEMVARAVTLASMGSVAHFSAYPPPAPVSPVRTYSERTLSLTSGQMIDGCQAIVDALKRHDPDLFISAGAGSHQSECLLVTSGGVCHHSRETGWGLGAHVQRTQGTDMLFSGYWRGWKDLNEFWDPGWISDRIVDDLRHGERIVEAPTGRTTVFLPPDAVSMFLMPLVMGVNGRNVAKGESPLRGRIGEQVLDPAITLVDNPHVDFSNGATEMDADGVPTRVNILFRQGVLEQFLYDLDTAAMAGVEPTGNDGCSPYFLELAPGAQSSDDLLAGIEDGLYVKSVIGFGQSNMMNGDVAGNVALGFRVRNGQIVGRVKNTMIAGNLYELLKANVRLSSDRDPVLHLPFAVIEGVSVSAT